MPRLRSRYLTCFYCGRRTSTPYDGRTRRFDCPSCDATNYLDENGDITDPPVATDKEATPSRKYAVPRALSPPASPGSADPIFCSTCLKNQHLLSASLAQYLPDPDDPDYAEREKGLSRFRRNQERLYPQICAACEPRVRQRLEQAAYTAKTDLLRRMIDRSASARKSVKTRGWLERFDAVGRWLWIAGFVLQLAWHAVVMHSLLSQYFIWAGAEDHLFTFRLLRACGPLLARLPSAERLLRWSIVASILGAWWNPRYAQIFRGFTRHISGVSKWYIYQVITLVIRIFLQRVWDMTTPEPRLLSIQLAAHTLGAGFALLIFVLSPRSVRINMTPIFGPTSKPLQLRDPPEQASSPSAASPSASRPDEIKSMAELLDEISRAPTSPTPPSPTDHSPTVPRRSTSPPMGHAHIQAAQTVTSSLQQIGSLHLSPSQRHRPTSSSSSPSAASPSRGYGYPSEMDWSPTPSSLSPSFASFGAAAAAKSPHRAFNTQGLRPAQPFGAAPTEPRPGPFWYRVPPAPTTPAQRVFNPPNRPGLLRASPVDRSQHQQQQQQQQQDKEKQKQGIRFRGADGTVLARDAATQPVSGGGEADADATGGGGMQTVAFAEPSFFADQVLGSAKNDPRDGLSGMFGEGFRLEDEGNGKNGGGVGGGWLRRLVGGGGEKAKKS